MRGRGIGWLAIPILAVAGAWALLGERGDEVPPPVPVQDPTPAAAQASAPSDRPTPVLRGAPTEPDAAVVPIADLPPGPRRALAVTVTDRDGAPVVSADIALRVPGEAGRWPTVAVAKTGADGRATLEIPAGVKAYADVTARGHSHQGVEVLPDAGEVTVQLQRGGGVEGRVLGPDGEPLAGILVHAGTGSTAPRVRTDAQGRYRFPLLPPHQDAWIFAWSGSRVPGGNTFGAKVSVEGGRRHVADLRLVEGLTTTGRVVRHDGEPVPDARVWVVVDSMWAVPDVYLETLVTRSAADGTFTIEGLPRSVSASSLAVHASAPGLPEGRTRLDPVSAVLEEAIWGAPPREGPLVEPREPEDPIEIVLSPPCFVDVLIVDEATGEGVPDARLGRGLNLEKEVARTDATGRCRVGPVTPGEHVWNVRARGWDAPWKEQAVTVEAVPDRVVEVRHEMFRTYDIRGRIVYEDGKPADDRSYGLALRLDGAFRLSTDVRDTFHVSGLAAGTYELLITQYGMESTGRPDFEDTILGRLVVETGTKDAVVVLHGARPRDLEVLALDTKGAPLPSGGVVVRAEDEEWNTYNAWDTIPLTNGRAVVTGVVHSLWIEVVPPPGSGLARKRVRRIAPGTPRVEVRLEQGSRTAGRVVDDRGAAVPDAKVRVFPDVDDAEYELFGYSHDYGSGRTDADGRFAFDRLAAGVVWLVVEPPEGLAGEGAVRATAGDEDVVVHLRHRIEVAVPILDAGGRPVAGAKVGAWRPPYFHNDSGTQAVTDSEGVAYLQGVDPEATLYLEVVPPRERGDVTALRRWDWRASTTPVRLPAARAFRGVVLGPDGRPASGARVTLLHDDGRPPSSLGAGEDGCFLFHRQPFAPVRLRARAEGSSTETVTVGTTQEEVVLRLQAHAGTLRIRVADWPAPPPIDAPWKRDSTHFSVWDPACPEDAIHGVPKSDGTVEVEGLDPAIPWSVVIRRTDKDLCARLDGVRADGVERRVPATPSRPVRGRLVVPEGLWPDEVRVPEANLDVDADSGTGEFEIRGLPPGRWSLRASAHHGRTRIYRRAVGSAEAPVVIEFPTDDVPR